jgi:hypothetical protein
LAAGEEEALGGIDILVIVMRGGVACEISTRDLLVIVNL